MLRRLLRLRRTPRGARAPAPLAPAMRPTDVTARSSIASCATARVRPAGNSRVIVRLDAGRRTADAAHPRRARHRRPPARLGRRPGRLRSGLARSSALARLPGVTGVSLDRRGARHARAHRRHRRRRPGSATRSASTAPASASRSSTPASPTGTTTSAPSTRHALRRLRQLPAGRLRRLRPRHARRRHHRGQRPRLRRPPPRHRAGRDAARREGARRVGPGLHQQRHRRDRLRDREQGRAATSASSTSRSPPASTSRTRPIR